MPELNNTILKDKPQSVYYRFESGAELVDSSGNGYTLTNENSVTFGSGRFGQCADSGATNSTKRLNVASNVGIDGGNITMNLWFNAYAATFAGDHPALFCTFYYGGNVIDYRIGINTTGVFAARLKSAVAWQETAATAISANTWYMATLTYDGTNLRLYLNGQHMSSAAVSGSGTITGGYTTGTSLFGGAADPTIIYTSAKIDDAVIFNTALSADQIKELYEGRYLGEGYPHGTTTRTRELNTTILKNGITAYYKMDNGALTTDSSGNGYTLTNTNTVADGTGKFGGAADAGATNSNKKLSIASDFGINGNASMSVSFWVKMNTEIASGVQIFFNHRSTTGASRYFQVYYNYNAGTRVLQVDNSGTGVNYTITLGTTNWHHIVITRTTTTASNMYVDGVAVTGAAQSTGTVASAITTLFDDSSGSFYSSCMIDDVGVWNRALTSSEIQELYYNDAGPVALYHLNGNSTDFSGNNNHGTDNAITYSQANGKFGLGAGFVGGSGSRITIPSSFSDLGTFTFSLWLKTVATDGFIYSMRPTADNNNLQFEVSSSKVRLSAYTTGLAVQVTSTSNATSGNWIHIVATRSGANWNLYINGALESTNAAGYASAFGSDDIRIGTHPNGTSGVFTGSMDEFQIFNVAKDARWVRQQYALGRGLLI